MQNKQVYLNLHLLLNLFFKLNYKTLFATLLSLLMVYIFAAANLPRSYRFDIVSKTAIERYFLSQLFGSNNTLVDQEMAYRKISPAKYEIEGCSKPSLPISCILTDENSAIRANVEYDPNQTLHVTFKGIKHHDSIIIADFNSYIKFLLGTAGHQMVTPSSSGMGLKILKDGFGLLKKLNQLKQSIISTMVPNQIGFDAEERFEVSQLFNGQNIFSNMVKQIEINYLLLQSTFNQSLALGFEPSNELLASLKNVQFNYSNLMPRILKEEDRFSHKLDDQSSRNYLLLTSNLVEVREQSEFLGQDLIGSNYFNALLVVLLGLGVLSTIRIFILGFKFRDQIFTIRYV
jgi:hypothetical protein